MESSDEKLNELNGKSYELLKKISNDFKNTNNFKTSILPFWINNLCRHTHSELVRNKNGNKPKYYKRFKQGQIVYVDFGSNVYDEFSGGHYAVVLSSNDTKYNGCVTVCPLKTKRRKAKENEFDLKEVVKMEIENHISNSLSTLEKRIKILSSIRGFSSNIAKSEGGIVLLDKSYSGDEGIEKLDNLQNLSIEERIEVINDVCDYSDKSKILIVQEFKKHGIKFKKSQITLKFTFDWIDGEILNMRKAYEYFIAVQNEYSDLSDETLALPMHISTVSKYRIKKQINELDPLNKVELKSNYVEGILDKMKDNFIQ